MGILKCTENGEFIMYPKPLIVVAPPTKKAEDSKRIVCYYCDCSAFIPPKFVNFLSNKGILEEDYICEDCYIKKISAACASKTPIEVHQFYYCGCGTKIPGERVMMFRILKTPLQDYTCSNCEKKKVQSKSIIKGLILNHRPQNTKTEQFNETCLMAEEFGNGQ